MLVGVLVGYVVITVNGYAPEESKNFFSFDQLVWNVT